MRSLHPFPNDFLSVAFDRPDVFARSYSRDQLTAFVFFDVVLGNARVECACVCAVSHALVSIRPRGLPRIDSTDPGISQLNQYVAPGN